MSSSGAPPAPDYVSAAMVQGAANLQAAAQTGMLNNPNTYTPFGSQTVGWSQIDGKWVPSINQTFSPEQDRLYRSSVDAKQNMANAAILGSRQLPGMLQSGLDLSRLPGAPQSSGQRRDDVINAMMARVSQDLAGKRDQMNSDLIAAGIRPGTKAYAAQMDAINRQETDARQQAIISGGQEASRDFGMDSQARQQALAEMLTQRQTPLNEINAIISGAQVNNPFAGGLGYNGAGSVQAAPIAGAVANQGQAAMNQYNASQAALNGNISAGAGLLGSLGSAWLMK